MITFRNDNSEEVEKHTEDDEESVEEEEPKLKYKRLEADIGKILTTQAASAMAVSKRLVVLGTHNGEIFILDFDGNRIKQYSSNSATISDISIDAYEEYIASASIDDDSTQVFNYRRPLKCVSLDPNFRDTQQFVSGGLAGNLILSDKGWFGQKQEKILQHSGEGPIYAASWKGSLIAYANDEDKPKNEIVAGRPIQYVEVTLFQTDFIVCGIAPFKDMIVLLAYITDDITNNPDSNDTQQYKRPHAKRPEIRIINAFNEEISTDVLSLHGYQHYQANDYTLDYFPEEDMFYIVSPKDLVLSKPRDLDDHICWLLERSRYEEALTSLQEAQVWGGSKVYDFTDIGEKYLSYLIEEQEDFSKAAENCTRILKKDADLWEKWVFIFAKLRQLQEITPFIPFKDPQLSSTVYEMILAHFLNYDHQALCDTIMSWPSSIYNIQSVILLIENNLEKEPENNVLMECLAELYAYNHEPDKALEYNLRLLRPNVFDLIIEYNLFPAVQEKVILLMKFDQHLLAEAKKKANEEDEMKNELNTTKNNKSNAGLLTKATDGPAVRLLVENTHDVPIRNVVQRLRSHKDFLHIYLDALFLHDHHAGYEFHNEQVELYAEYDYPRLIDFLRSSNYYSLEEAFKICEQRDLVPEMVYILGRLGNNKKALMLIIERLQDVQRAIDFAKEQDDKILWEDLLRYSLDKPRFIIGLLENLGGTSIDPISLINRIPDRLEIPGLKDALIKVLQDFNLQASLREGCQRILVNDSVSMANQLHKAQKRGISIEENLPCSICSAPIISDSLPIDSNTATIIFFCRHAYHEECLFDNETLTTLQDSINKLTLNNKGVGSKVRHSTIIRDRISSPRGFVSSRSRQTLRDDDGMPPMVTLRL
ncbi:14882_t:CDS:10 [Entrophospora sp. SA101]|nr:14882_t:CDS:10 [Entrophospora sp. SA101]